jgi:4-amino-4-deoxy-L-arabinose transferase-like glycosyltransferase
MQNVIKLIVDFLAKKEGRRSQDILILLLLFSVLFFLFLGRFPLSDPDEGRYAEIPREMIEQGDLITPRLDYVKYFEKPPLLYWLNALSFTVFGLNEFAARFPSALCGLMGILLTYQIGWKLFGRRPAFLGALVLGSSVGYLSLGRVNITDMVLTFCLTASLGSFLLATRDGEQHRGAYFHLFYASAAFAVLAKGLIGVLFPGAVIFFYLLFTRRWRTLREMRLATGIPLFLVIAAPWFILVSIKNPEFPRFFFIHEHFERYLTKVHGRYQPFWFFIPVVLGLMLPWSLFFPAAARTLWRQRKAEAGDPVLFLALWAGVIFLFFSLSDSKLVPYILPDIPPAALLLGISFSRVLETDVREVWYEGKAAGVVLLVLGAAIIVYAWSTRSPKIGLKEAEMIGGLLFCQGVLMLTVLRRSKIASAVAILAALACILGICTPLLTMEDLAEWKSSKGLGLIVREKAGKETIVASCGMFQQGFLFYSRRRVELVDEENELSFGSKQEGESAWFIDRESFYRQWDSAAPLFALVNRNDLARLRCAVRTSVHILGENGEKLLISNR